MTSNTPFFTGAHPLVRGFMDQRKPSRAVELPQEIQAVLAKPIEFYQELAKQRPLPTDKQLTHVAFILDKSGSMELGKATTIEGFNEQVKVVKEGAKEAGEVTFTEVFFSTTVEVGRVAGDVHDVPKLTDASYRPEGMTALYDSLGDTIAALLKAPHIDSPATATLVTLFTDGGENSSVRYSAQTLSELVKRLEATGRWTFALVGPRDGVNHLADLLAVKKSNTAGYDPTSIEGRTQVFASMASASNTYMSMRSMGATQVADLYASVGPLQDHEQS